MLRNDADVVRSRPKAAVSQLDGHAFLCARAVPPGTLERDSGHIVTVTSTRRSPAPATARLHGTGEIEQTLRLADERGVNAAIGERRSKTIEPLSHGRVARRQ